MVLSLRAVVAGNFDYLIKSQDYGFVAMDIRDNTHTTSTAPFTNHANFQRLEESQIKLSKALEEVTTSIA